MEGGPVVPGLVQWHPFTSEVIENPLHFGLITFPFSIQREQLPRISGGLCVSRTLLCFAKGSENRQVSRIEDRPCVLVVPTHIVCEARAPYCRAV